MPVFGLPPAYSRTPQWIADSAKLGPSELAKVVAFGESVPVRSNATVLADGTVHLTVTRSGRTVGYRTFKLSGADMHELKRLIAVTNFSRLRSSPAPVAPPDAFDGLDELLVVRQNLSTVWWSDAVFAKPPNKFPLLDRMRSLLHNTVA